MALGTRWKRWLAILALPAAMAVIWLCWEQVRKGDGQVADLDQLIDQADSLVVYDSPGASSSPLYTSTNPADLAELKAALKLRWPQGPVHCMCDGTPAIFLQAKGQSIGWITNHHMLRVRTNLWKTDVEIVDPEGFLHWFDARKIDAPRREYEEAEARDKQWRENQRRWEAAMPACLAPYREQIRNSFNDDWSPLEKTLTASIPDQRTRLLALFAWYGSGEGPWSGFASYEEVPEKLLLGYSTPELLAAIDKVTLTPAQTEGVARLFGGWDFYQLRGADQALLPAELKARLLAHSLQCDDEDKKSRARAAFSPKDGESETRNDSGTGVPEPAP